MTAFIELWPPILAKRPPARGLATKSVSFAEGTRGQKARSMGRLPAAAAADFAALAGEEVRTCSLRLHSHHVLSSRTPCGVWIRMHAMHCCESRVSSLRLSWFNAQDAFISRFVSRIVCAKPLLTRPWPSGTGQHAAASNLGATPRTMSGPVPSHCFHRCAPGL